VKLSKKTRKRLYEAGTEVIKISWPASAPEPWKGRRYPVYSKDGRLSFHVRVEWHSKRAAKVQKAKVRIDNDSSRPMIGISGVRRDDGSYESEPERVHKLYEDRMALEASAPNACVVAEHVRQAKLESRESSTASTPRSQRTKERHSRALSRTLVSG
jgi:hypothetical protein